MSTVRFVLSNYTREDQRTQLYLQYGHNEKKCLFATDIKVNPKAWQAGRQIVKHVSTIPNVSKDSDLYKQYERLDKNINRSLELKRIEFENFILERKDESLSLDIKSIKEAFNDIHRNQKKRQQSLLVAFDLYIKKHPEFTAGTIKNYRSVINKIEEYKPSITVGEMEKAEGLDDYRKWLERTMKEESAGNHIKTVKAVLSYTLKDRGTYEAVKVKKNKPGESKTEYLAVEELLKLESFEDDTKPELMNIKRIFIFMATTGMRISDAKKIIKSGEDLRACFQYHDGKPFIPFIAQKTGKTTNVPLSAIGIRNLEKCDYKLEFLTEQYINRSLKDLMKIPALGLDKTIIKIGKQDSVKELRSDNISTKSAKVSFVMMLLDAGFSDEEICDITRNSAKTLQHYKRIRPERNFNTIGKLDQYLLSVSDKKLQV